MEGWQFRMPHESARQAGVMMTWPSAGDVIQEARDELLQIANAISKHQPVMMMYACDYEWIDEERIPAPDGTVPEQLQVLMKSSANKRLVPTLNYGLTP